MQVHFQTIEEDPDHIAWVQCDREDLPEVEKIFPVEKYEILVGIRPNYDPLTCDTHTLNNPPAPTWGVDIRKRKDAGHKDLSFGENS